MKLRVALALLSVLIVPAAVDGQDRSDPPPTAEQTESARRLVMKMLSECKLPKVEMEKCSVRDAIEFFATKIRRFNILVKYGDEGVPPFPPAAGNVANIPGLDDPPFGVPVARVTAGPLITIHRRNMSAREFFDEVCQQSGMQWVIEYPGNIVITPKPK
jgi:hypothetical protein